MRHQFVLVGLLLLLIPYLLGCEVKPEDKWPVVTTFEIQADLDVHVKIDKNSDALYFRLDESRIVESEEIRPGVILDYDKDNRVIGVEFLSISQRATKEELSSLQFQTA